MKLIRLNRYIALCGIASRRGADDLIDQGKVKVNGKIVRKKGITIDPEKDEVIVDNENVIQEEKIYILMNKPKGFITTSSDPEGRPTVLDLIKEKDIRVYPVGRLDFNTQGLLLLTNDGELSYRLLHPKYHVYKTYRVKIYGAFSPVKIKKMSEGVELTDGLTAPCDIKLLKALGKETIIEMRIHEGRKRQIRRMCNAVGYKVVELIRVQFGNIKLGNLRHGHYRYLGPNELKKLKELAGLD